MPSNNPYNNDPYGEISMVGMAKDAALAPFSIGFWGSMYTTWPGMWSIEKGAYVPFVGKYIERGGGHALAAMKHIGRSYQGRGFIGGTFTAAKRTVGAFNQGGMVGKRFFDKGINSVDKINQRITSQSIKNELYTSSINKINQGIDKITNSYKGTSKTKLRNVAKAYKNMVNEREIYEKLLSQGKRNLGRYSTLATKAKGRLVSITAAKLGIGAMKAVSAVGAALFAWDIIKMVGEPLGAAAANSLYNTAQDMQERFMPELGGDLSVAYLSRQAATERQRALQAMSKASITGRSAFGQEARMQHM